MNNNRMLREWLYADGTKITTSKTTGQPVQSAGLVYIWDMYIDPKDKGTWTSAEKYKIEWVGTVFETEQEAIDAGHNHLIELEDERELKGKSEDYTVETIAIPISEVSDETLLFSGL